MFSVKWFFDHVVRIKSPFITFHHTSMIIRHCNTLGMLGMRMGKFLNNSDWNSSGNGLYCVQQENHVSGVKKVLQQIYIHRKTHKIKSSKNKSKIKIKLLNMIHPYHSTSNKLTQSPVDRSSSVLLIKLLSRNCSLIIY